MTDLTEESIEEKADKIRVQILKLSDEDLLWYSYAIHSENFETLTERIQRVAKEHVKSMPF